MIVDVLSWLLIVVGGALGIVGGIGLIRFPDIYTRLHAVGVTDTGCAALVLLGLGLQAGWSVVCVKLFLIYAFLFFTCPASGFSLGNAARQEKIRPWDKDRPAAGQARD